MMIAAISETIRYILTLLFGVLVTAGILNIRITKKNIMILSVFCAVNLCLQSILISIQNLSLVTASYPLITHLPLLLLMIFVFHKKIIPAVLGVTTAYLCCQICNWMSTIPEVLQAPSYVVDLTYITAIIITFPLVMHFVVPSISVLFSKPDNILFSFCILPVFYYIFDYIATVYTGLLYSGNHIIAEFIPFLLCICYLLFCIVYFKQYEEKNEIVLHNQLMRMKHEQSEKELETLRKSEKTIRLIRHDMRHFLSNISVFIDNGELDKAQEYIHSIIKMTDNTIHKCYCNNNTINIILSSYADTFAENETDFHYTIQLPENLPYSDTDITSILSNALENALHAVLLLPAGKRRIELRMIQKSGKILISLSNPYAVKPTLVNGIPVSTKKEHGFGTQSIQYTTEKLNGNCQFIVTEEEFVLQIVL